MSGWQLGEGTTPPEIADPERNWPRSAEADSVPAASVPTSSRRRWALVGSGVLLVALAVWFNPFVGSASGHYFASSKYTSSGYGLGYGSRYVLAGADQHLRVEWNAKVKSGHLVIHIWRTGFQSFGEPSVKTIRIRDSERSSVEIRLPKAGLYRIEIDTFRDGPSFDIDYEVAWRVR